MSKSKHFCVLPWVAVHINQDGRLTSCCRANFERDFSYGNLHEKTLNEIWNDNPIKEMRRDLLADKAVNQCRNCYQVEASGGESFRQITNKAFSDSLPEVLNSNPSENIDLNKLSYLEVRFSNVCNLKCRTCEPSNSTSWYAESEIAHYSKAPKNIIRPTKEVAELQILLAAQLPYLKYLNFLGGEPLLDDTHYWLIEQLIQQNRTDISLKYNTNFTRLQHKHWNILKLWS